MGELPEDQGSEQHRGGQGKPEQAARPSELRRAEHDPQSHDPQQREGRSQDRRTGDDRRQEQGRTARRAPGAVGDHRRMEQPWEQQVDEHGRRTPVHERGEEGRRERPRDAGEDAQSGPIGDPSRGEPSAEDGERQREDPQQHHREGRRARPQRPQDGDDRGERVGRSDEIDTDPAQTPCRVLPQRAHGLTQGQEATASQRRPRQETREGGDAHHQRGQHRPGSAPGEEAELADGTVLAAVPVVEPTTQLCGGDAQRGDARPAGGTERTDPGARSGDGAETDHREESRPPLREHGLRPLADEMGEGTPQCEWQERQPVQRHGGGRRIGEAAVQLCEAGDEGAACSSRRERRRAVRGGGDPRSRSEDDTAASEPRAHAEVETLVGTAEGGIGAQRLAHLAADEQAADVGAEGVVHPVVLALVQLPRRQLDRAAERGHAHTQGDDLALIVGGDEFRRDDRGGRRALQHAREALQRTRVRGGVLREDPDRRSVEDAGARQIEGLGEGGRRARLDDALDGRGDGFALPCGGGVAADDQRDGRGRERLRAHRVERAEELGAGGGAGARDDEGMNSGWHDVVSLCGASRGDAHRSRRAREAVPRSLVSWRDA